MALSFWGRNSANVSAIRECVNFFIWQREMLHQWPSGQTRTIVTVRSRRFCLFFARGKIHSRGLGLLIRWSRIRIPRGSTKNTQSKPTNFGSWASLFPVALWSPRYANRNEPLCLALLPQSSSRNKVQQCGRLTPIARRRAPLPCRSGCSCQHQKFPIVHA